MLIPIVISKTIHITIVGMICFFFWQEITRHEALAYWVIGLIAAVLFLSRYLLKKFNGCCYSSATSSRVVARHAGAARHSLAAHPGPYRAGDGDDVGTGKRKAAFNPYTDRVVE